MKAGKKTHLRLLQEIVSLRTILIVVLFGILGTSLLFFVSAKTEWSEKHPIATILLTQLGSLFIVTTTITIGWELVGKRAFAEEILEKANMSRELAEAGINKVFGSFHEREIDWIEFFETACEIDLLFLYAHSWRSSRRVELETFLSASRRRLRVILPDPSKDEVMAPIATNCDMTVKKLKERVEDARDEFARLAELASSNGSVVEIWFLQTVPTFSFYCSNRLLILALKTNRREKANVPTLVCRKPGIMYQYIREEVSGMLEGENPTAMKWKIELETKS